MAEATTDIQRLSDNLWRRTMKKAKDQPKPVVILQLRTLSTAIEILDWISNIPVRGTGCKSVFLLPRR
jgi:hypothetical protein